VKLSIWPVTGIYTVNGIGAVLTITTGPGTGQLHANPFFANHGPMMTK
jgi:hypothetical protein